MPTRAQAASAAAAGAAAAAGGHRRRDHGRPGGGRGASRHVPAPAGARSSAAAHGPARSPESSPRSLDRLRVAALMTTAGGRASPAPARPSRTPPVAACSAPLRGQSQLELGGAAARGRARRVVALPALLLTLPAGALYAHWLTITLILTLQPFFALTWQRALERIGGTVLGGIAGGGDRRVRAHAGGDRRRCCSRWRSSRSRCAGSASACSWSG